MKILIYTGWNCIYDLVKKIKTLCDAVIVYSISFLQMIHIQGVPNKSVNIFFTSTVSAKNFTQKKKTVPGTKSELSQENIGPPVTTSRGKSRRVHVVSCQF